MKIILPLSVTLPRKKGPDKIWYLGLNQYRNTHHFTLNQAKIAYAALVERALVDLFHEPIPAPLRFTYTVYAGSGRKFDLSNVLSVVQKFTDDALISVGFIPDDNYKVIPRIEYRFGGVDKNFPRVELEIRPFSPSEDVCREAEEAGL